MKDPAFLFYPSDFLTGVTDLTMEERGQYITLLCLQHQKGNLTEKTIRLSLGSVSVDVLNKFTKTENGEYFNERLAIEIDKRALFVDSRRNNGSKGGRPKSETKPSGLPSAEPLDKPKGKARKNLPINVNINEVIDYFKEHGFREDVAIRVFKSYETADWHDSNGKQILNWKQKMQMVWFKPENAIDFKGGNRKPEETPVKLSSPEKYNPNGRPEKTTISAPSNLFN